MPNHFHGIIFIHEVGADRCVGPGDMEKHDGLEKGEHIELNDEEKKGAHIGAPLQDGMGEQMKKGEQAGLPLRGTTRPNAPLSEIVQWFKTMTTNEYIRGVKQSHWQPFAGKLWQRNYYEHIIRNQGDYERIFNYIAADPSNWAEDEDVCTQRMSYGKG